MRRALVMSAMRRGATVQWTVLAMSAVIVAAVLVAWQNAGARSTGSVSRLGNPPVGTAGRDSAPEPADTDATLHDIETMTGSVDEHELIGRRVDFHVVVADTASAGAFWIGKGDNRELVVPSRTRTAAQPIS